MKTARVLLVLGVLLGGALPARAGTNRWTGPSKAQTVFNWIAAHPTNSRVLYAATDKGLLKSTDGGVDWVAINEGVFEDKPLEMSVIVVSHDSPQTLFALNGERPQAARYVPEGGDIFKSTNGGQTWTEVWDSTEEGLLIHALVLDPTNADVAYVGTATDRVYKTVDGGAEWDPSSSGLPVEPVLALAIDPNDSQTVYASQKSGIDDDTRISETVDGGANWTQHSTVTALAQGYTSVLEVHPIGSALWSSLKGLVSVWNGVNAWRQGDFTNADAIAIAPDPTTEKRVYAAIEGEGVWRVDEKPAEISGVEFNNGLDDLDVRTLVISPASPNQFWAGTDQGVFRYTRKTTTNLTLEVTKTQAKATAKGKLTPPHPDSSVRVALYEKRQGKWKKVGQKEADLNAQSRYSKSFARRDAGTCKFVVRFTEDADHLSSKKSKTFGC